MVYGWYEKLMDWQYLFSSFSSNCYMMWKLFYIWFIFWTRNRFRWHFLLLIKFSDWQMENSILSICLERDGGRQYPWRLQNKSGCQFSFSSSFLLLHKWLPLSVWKCVGSLWHFIPQVLTVRDKCKVWRHGENSCSSKTSQLLVPFQIPNLWLGSSLNSKGRNEERENLIWIGFCNSQNDQ